MREFIEPEVANAIHARANRKCECENPRCKHVARYCRNGHQCQERHHATGGSEDGSREVRERSGRLPGVLSAQQLLLPTAANGHVRSVFLIAARGSERIKEIWHWLQTATAAELGIGV